MEACYRVTCCCLLIICADIQQMPNKYVNGVMLEIKPIDCSVKTLNFLILCIKGRVKAGESCRYMNMMTIKEDVISHQNNQLYRIM